MELEKNNNGRAIFPWLGGKAAIADRVIQVIPPHRRYVEVFAGAAWILFRKPESHVEVINDINLELVTLYRVIKHHLDEFVRCLRWLLTAREEFQRFKAMNPDTLTDVQRAVRFYYLQRNAFVPGRAGPSFRCDGTRPPRFNLLRIEEELSAAHIRLSSVFIENLPYRTVIERFDSAETFFYIDPPYWGCEAHYGKGIFARDDFAKLRELLDQVKGRFIMSINDRPEIRSIYRGFTVRQVTMRYKAGRARGKVAQELLISNFRPGGRRGEKTGQKGL